MQLDLSSIWTPSFWGQGQEGGLHPCLGEPLQGLPRKHRIGMGLQEFQGEDLLLRHLFHILCYVIIWAKFLRDVLSILKWKKCGRNVKEMCTMRDTFLWMDHNHLETWKGNLNKVFLPPLMSPFSLSICLFLTPLFVQTQIIVDFYPLYVMLARLLIVPWSPSYHP